MNKAAKTILRSLRCPICKGEVDLYDYLALKSKSTSFNFCCVRNYYHYRMWFPHWDDPPRIYHDQVEIYQGHHKYQIEQRYIEQRYGVSETTINSWEVDAEHHLLDERNKTFTCQKILFDWPNTNVDRIVNRIKTVLTFQ